MATQDTGDQRTWQGQSAATTGKDPDRIPADLPTPAAPALKDQAPLAMSYAEHGTFEKVGFDMPV